MHNLVLLTALCSAMVFQAFRWGSTCKALVPPHAHADGGGLSPVVGKQEGSLTDLLCKPMLQLPQDCIASAHRRQVEHQRLGIHNRYAGARAALCTNLHSTALSDWAVKRCTSWVSQSIMKDTFVQTTGNRSLVLCRSCTAGIPYPADARSASEHGRCPLALRPAGQQIPVTQQAMYVSGIVLNVKHDLWPSQVIPLSGGLPPLACCRNILRHCGCAR